MTSLFASMMIVLSAIFMSVLSVGCFCEWVKWAAGKCKDIWCDFKLYKEHTNKILKARYKKDISKALYDLFLYSLIWLLIVAFCVAFAGLIWSL